MFRFNITPEAIKRTEEAVKATFKKAVSDPALMTEIGKLMTDRVRYQARVTKPANDTQNFPGLSPKTVGHRRYLAKYNAVDPTYNATRSNLTLSGAFLNSLSFTVTAPGEVTLSFVGQHPGYATKRGRTKNNPTNQQLYSYLTEKGFFALTQAGVENFKELRKRLNSVIASYLRRSFKT